MKKYLQVNAVDRLLWTHGSGRRNQTAAGLHLKNSNKRRQVFFFIFLRLILLELLGFFQSVDDENQRVFSCRDRWRTIRTEQPTPVGRVVRGDGCGPNCGGTFGSYCYFLLCCYFYFFTSRRIIFMCIFFPPRCGTSREIWSRELNFLQTWKTRERETNSMNNCLFSESDRG